MTTNDRELEIGEGRLTLLVAGLLSVLSLTFYLGVRVGRASAVPGAPVGSAVAGHREPAPGAARAAASPAAGGASSAPAPARPLASVAPAGASPMPVSAAGGRSQPTLPRGFIGPPPVPSPAPIGSLPGGGQRATRRGFTLEVLSTTDSDQALELRRRLLGYGYPSYVAPGKDSSGAARYGVRVGDYGLESEAATVRDRLRDREGLQATILP